MFKPEQLLAQSSNSSIINLLLGATNTPGSLVCKYLAKAAVMKLTASVSRWLGVPREAAYVQNHSRWKRNQQKSTATVSVCTKDIIDQQNESCFSRHWKNWWKKPSPTWKGLIGWDGLLRAVEEWWQPGAKHQANTQGVWIHPKSLQRARGHAGCALSVSIPGTDSDSLNYRHWVSAPSLCTAWSSTILISDIFIFGGVICINKIKQWCLI